MEFQLHSRLINKMKVKGMNAVFGLSTQVAIGDTMLVAIAVSSAQDMKKTLSCFLYYNRQVQLCLLKLYQLLDD